MDDNTIYKAANELVLRIVSSQNTGSQYPLSTGKKKILGRSDDCDIIIEGGDSKISRRHLALSVIAGGCLVEDLGSSNGTLINGRKITGSQALSCGEHFFAGMHEFVVEEINRQKSGDQKITPESSGSNRKRFFVWLGLVLSLLVAIGILVMTFRGSRKQELNSTLPENGKPRITLEKQQYTPHYMANQSLQANHSFDQQMGSESSEKAHQHYQQGLFFFNAGRLNLAAKELNKAIILDNNSRKIRKWLVRVEDELECEIDKYYYAGFMNLKYMRSDQARENFRIVVEWSKDRTSDRYRNALQRLDELQDE